MFDVFYEISRIGKHVETESRLAVVRRWRERGMESDYLAVRCYSRVEKKVLKLERGMPG